MKIHQASRAVCVLLVGCIPWAAACGDSEGEQGTECDQPGANEACVCDDGAQGARICGSDQSWSDCSCDQAAAGGATGSGGTSAQTGGATTTGGNAALGAGGTAAGGALSGAGGTPVGAGGASVGAGGMVVGSGGVVVGAGGTVVGAGGTVLGSGGEVVGAGGTFEGAGGTLVGSGGAPGSGGAITGSGGDVGSGGAAPGSGGEVVGAGGTVEGTGGTVVGSGGDPGSGGAITGSGGDVGSGGTNPGTGGGSTVDPNATAQISACIDSLPWGQDNIEDRDAWIGVIIRTCMEFAPPGDEWQTYCQMHLATAINKESSYNRYSVVEDSYGGATDPTVGLLQIRFSSTVVDFDARGPLDAMERIGCTWPTISDGDTALDHMDFMQDVACNIALGAWYYYVYATGNGGDSVVYHWQYCDGQGVASNLTIGLLSHLRGPGGALHGDEENPPDPYVTEIRGWFDTCLAVNDIQVSGTHPFEQTLQPEPAKYCR